MHKYEVMYILRADLEDTAIQELINRFNGVITGGGGTVDSVDTQNWGKRRLAYTIDYQNEGYYVLETFTAGPELPAELERNFKINENVIRFLVTRLDD